MREGGCRKGALAPKDQSLSCHLLTGLKSFNLSWKVGVIIQAYSHEVLWRIIDLFDLEKCLINKKKKSRVIDVPTVRGWRHGPYSRVCEREASSLELFIFHVNEKEGGCLSNGAQNVIFLSLPGLFFFFFLSSCT